MSGVMIGAFVAIFCGLFVVFLSAAQQEKKDQENDNQDKDQEK